MAAGSVRMTLIDFGSPDLCAQVEQALELEDTRRRKIEAATAALFTEPSPAFRRSETWLHRMPHWRWLVDSGRR